MAQRAQGRAARRADRWPSSGRDYEQFMRDLSAHLRHLLVTQIGGEVPDTFAVTAAATPTGWPSRPRRSPRASVLRAIDLLAAAIGGGEGRLGAAAAARGGAAEGHPAPGRPVAPGADVPDRPARGAASAARRCAAAPAPAEAPPDASGARQAAVVAGRGEPSRCAVEVEEEDEPGRAAHRPRADRGHVVGAWPTPCASRTRWSPRWSPQAVPSALEGDRLTVVLPGRRRLPQEEGRGQPRARARRAAHPHRARRSRWRSTSARARGGARPRTLGRGGAARAAPARSSAPRRSSRRRPTED